MAKSPEAYRRRRLEHRSEASACSYVYSAYYSGAVLNIHVALHASLQSYIDLDIPFVKYFKRYYAIFSRFEFLLYEKFYIKKLLHKLLRKNYLTKRLLELQKNSLRDI